MPKKEKRFDEEEIELPEIKPTPKKEKKIPKFINYNGIEEIFNIPDTK